MGPHGKITEKHEVRLRGWKWVVALWRREPRRYIVIDKIEWQNGFFKNR